MESLVIQESNCVECKYDGQSIGDERAGGKVTPLFSRQL
jgi:hypothetical protein